MGLPAELVFVGAVLLAVGLPATAQLTAQITPQHLHSAPRKEVTFTCEANEVVSDCEFRVQYNGVDLPVVETAQSAEGSWPVASSPWSSGGVKGRGEDRTPSRSEAVQGEDAAGKGPRPSSASEDWRGTSPRTSNYDVLDRAGETPPRRPLGSSRRRVGSPDRHVFGTEPTTWPSRPNDLRVTQHYANSKGSPETDTSDEVDEDGDVQEALGEHRLTVLHGTGGGAIKGGVSTLPARSPEPRPYRDDKPQTSESRRAENRFIKWGKGGKPTKAPPSAQRVAPRFAGDGYRWKATSGAGRGCALTLPEVQPGRHVVGCRVRKQNGGWQFALASLDVNAYLPLGMTSQSLPPISSPDLKTTVSCRSTASTMTSCNVDGGKGLLFSRNECMHTVSPQSRPVWCRGVKGSTHQESVAVFLRMRSPPPTVELQLSPSKGPYLEGTLLTATCAVGPAQPQGNITWTMDNEVLRADADDDFPSDEWAWPWQGRGLKQSTHLTLSSFDDGLELQCHAGHPARAVVRSALIRVTSDDDDGTADCGLIAAPAQPNIGTRISGGVPTRATAAPWAVAVYRRMRSGDIQQVCGGTLVSRRLVVSSAQCFWDATFERVADAALFRVAVGKRRRSWEHEERDAQAPGIRRIALPKFYLGRPANFQYDIAVVVLDAPVTLTPSVGVACLDRNEQLGKLVSGQSGLVVGWGVTESGRASPWLRALQLPFVPFKDCARAIDGDLQRFLSHDKFCAGFRNESKSVCPGDSGGGLVFKDASTGKHYLRGVASIAFAPIGNDDSCFADLYTGFTDAGEYVSWIFKQAPAAATASTH